MRIVDRRLRAFGKTNFTVGSLAWRFAEARNSLSKRSALVPLLWSEMIVCVCSSPSGGLVRGAGYGLGGIERKVKQTKN